MRKHKLLMPIITGVSAIGLAGSMVGVLTGCSCKKKSKTHIESAITDATIVGNNMVAYWQFTLVSNLSDDEVLTADVDDKGEQFVIGQAEVNNKLVTIPVYWLEPDTHQEYILNTKVVFTCSKKKSNDKVWSQTINNINVKYEPYCTLKSQREITTKVISDDKKRIEATYEVNFPNGLPKDYPYHLEAQINQRYSDSQFNIDENDIQIEVAADKQSANIIIPAEIKEQSAVGDGDKMKFDMQIYCMYGSGEDETDIPIWISSSFIGLTASYYDFSNPIPDDKLIFKPAQTPGYCYLTGVNVTENDGYNTLVIPTHGIVEGETEPLQVIGVGDGTNPINLPNTITKLVFGAGDTEHPAELSVFKPNAFANCNSIRYIDASTISDKAEGLDLMTFGENSFAGWNDEGGTIIWGNDFSQYKRHMLIANLYSAGLTNTKWYNITEVHNESELREACGAGANIQLANDITIAARADYTGQIDIKESLVMDFHGHTVTSAAPIYNYDEKDFAIFGIWYGAEVVATDLSSGHNGGVKAFDQSANYETYHNQIPHIEGEGHEPENELWNYAETEKREGHKWKPREERCFYLRTDTPSMSRTSLEIMTGQYYGNCTTVMNWNGVCWIEETFKDEDKHTYAPQFHALIPFDAYADGSKADEGARELINCDDGNGATGDAYFEVYGGKYYGVPKESDHSQYDLYDPEHAKADTDWEGHCPANWLASHRYSIYECSVTTHTDEEISIPYNLVTTKLK